MIKPNEMQLVLPMQLSNNVISTTTKVWDMLVASRMGDLESVKNMAAECPELIYAQYNYTPPIHFAVREGHTGLVKYLLNNGAHDPGYTIYPFRDNLLTIAQDRNHYEIALLLQQYADNSRMHNYKGDNGSIHFKRTAIQQAFEEAVDRQDTGMTGHILKEHPELVHDNSFFWGEGIMMMPAKDGNHTLLELLLRYAAKVPAILKWTQAYYFKYYDTAAFLLKNGMSPNVKSWQQVTILHDMAQKGNIPKAQLLIKHGAAIDAVEDEYRSTPLGMAARWGHTEMTAYLLKMGADPNKSGAPWATPLSWARKKGHDGIATMLLKAGAQ